MTHTGQADDTAPVTRSGGLPLAPEDFEWPMCASCRGPMMFVAQLQLADLARFEPVQHAKAEGLLAIWMCLEDPGMCESWSPVDGSNAARIFPAAQLRPVSPPRTGARNPDALLPPEPRAVTYEQVQAEGYDEARVQWTGSVDESTPAVLGGLGGAPSWLQGDETPKCPSCENLMSFTAHLEEVQGSATDGVFGGGCAYVFHCQPCATAAFLWQC